jgi:inositol-phosphate phosphatase/L-galactose 1-phosphate phosphatase/histidinol-phosphatase
LQTNPYPQVYDDFFAFANQLLDASGEILRQDFIQPLAIEQKADFSPVTKADYAVEQCLRQMIIAKFPEHGIVGEEFENTAKEAEYKWVIDPIDGTKSFIAGYPIFTTLIALLHNDIPIIGLIDQPILRQRFANISGREIKISGQSKKSLAEAIIATTSTAYFSPACALKFAELRKNCATIVLGGDAYAYAMLASGRLDIVVDASMKPYDFCALVPIIEGAGGVISDWSGNQLTLNSDGSVLACANQELHQAALKILQKHS